MIARMLLRVACLFASCTTLSGTEVINTLNAPEQSLRELGIESNMRSAQSFRTTAAVNIITDVTLKMHSTVTTGTFKVSIYDGTGLEGSPGALVANIFSGQVSDLPIGPFQDFHIGGLNVSLDFESEYYIVADVGPYDELYKFVYWQYTDSPPPGSHGETSVYWESEKGLPWTGMAVGTPQLMRVVAIPEPGTYMLSCIAVILLAIAGKRRRRTLAAA
jgi:hypothetical protein